MRRLVVDLEDRRPIWRVPDEAIERIRAALPEAWEAVVVRAPAVGTGDGGGRASKEAIEAVRDAEVYLGCGVPPEILVAGGRLRWVHTGTAGVGGSLTPEMLESDVVFTNSAGVHGAPVAETVLAVLLHFARGLDIALDAQRRGRWDKGWFDDASSPVREVGGGTVGIVGFGGIGRAVAERVRALGARVLAVKRVPGEAGADIELLYGDDGLRRVLEESDYVVVTVPETDETRGLIDGAALGRMKPDAVLVNVSRGGVVEQEALVAALSDGRLRGAALDVFAEEPLPDGHALWRLPNAVVTPHVSCYTHGYWDRETALVVENIERYLAGERLLNVVDKAAGY